MNPRLILGLPWRATSRSSRIITAFVAIAIVSIVMPLAKLYRGSHWAGLGAGLCCFAIAVLWLLMMPNALWLARDARALRLPKIARYADWSLAAWALLSIVLPALVLGAFAGHTLELLTLFTLIASACMAGQLLPFNATIVLIVLGLAASHMQALSLPPQQRIVWIAPLAIVLTGVWIWRWWRLSRSNSLHSGLWGIPIISIWRRNITRSFLDSFAPPSDVLVARAGGTWLRLVPDLRGVDREHPVRAIRVALTRGTVPLTMGSRVRQWSFSVLIVLAVVGVSVGLSPGARHVFSALLFSRSAWFWLQTGSIIVAILPLQHVAGIRQRWTATAAELPLLGLLPGLGTPDQQKRHLLRAIFLHPAYWLVAVLAIGIGIIGATHAPAWDCLYVLLVVAGSAGLLASNVLTVVGGKPLSDLAACIIAVTFLILIMVTTLLFVQSNAPASTTITLSKFLLLSIWLIWLIAVLWLARRGWRGLQQRPHPFLPN